MSEFSRALRTLKALQAGQAIEARRAPRAHPLKAQPEVPTVPTARPVHRPQPDEPKRAAAHPLEYVLTEPRTQARALHESAALWMPNQPEPRQSWVLGPAKPKIAPNQAGPTARPQGPTTGAPWPPPAVSPDLARL